MLQLPFISNNIKSTPFWMKYNCQTKNFLTQLEIKWGAFMMEKERSGLFCRRIRYDGAWETVYFLESGGGLWLPEPLLRARGLFPGRRLAVGKVCPQSVELSLEAAGPAAVEAGGFLRVPIEVWSRTSMEPGRSWLALFPLSSSLFLMDRGIL